MRVLLVSTWETACGIAEHSAMLKENVELMAPEIEIVPCAEALDPRWRTCWPDVDVIHLNYQASLHSRWTPEVIRTVRDNLGVPIVVTYHDTGVPNSEQCRDVCDAADVTVVHEPYTDLQSERTHYWRMGVPAATPPLQLAPGFPQRWPGQPILGSIGFPFPWKNYDLLARLTARLGWALLLVAPTATREQIAHWHTLTPDLYVRSTFVRRREALSLLSVCDATAFPYVCNNTGQSAAILQGVAARKPVVAFSTCRQFRALHLDDLGHHVIKWAETVEDLEEILLRLPIGRVDAGMVALAEQDSWEQLGRRYATLYQEVAHG